MSANVPALQTLYKEKVIGHLKSKLNYDNINQVPKIEKIVVNCSVGSQADRKAAVEDAARDVAAITGQKPVITKSRVSISNFKLRENENIGVKVTLRGRAMYEFLERLTKLAIPVIRDFRGVSAKAFDGRGNYTLGISDQSIFPEIKLDEVKRVLGMDICIVTSANSDDEGRELLRAMGMPFRGAKKDGEAEAAKN
jgi:large subunit ribosomal protein L5